MWESLSGLINNISQICPPCGIVVAVVMMIVYGVSKRVKA